MRKTALVVALALTAVVSGTATGASASPPSGDLKFEDLGRATVAADATVKAPARTGVFSAGYTLAPGSSAGWRSHPGPAVLVVTAGELAVSLAGCATTRYPAGQAVVVPAGPSLVANPGSAALTLVGTFTALPPGAPRPLADGAPEAAPAGCAALPVPAVSPPALTEYARGTMVGAEGYYGYPPPADTFEVKAGQDVLVTRYTVGPRSSAGWHTHASFIAIPIRGHFNYYEGHDGKCVLSGRYGPGEAYYYIRHHGHSHLGYNDGDEPYEAIAVFFNVSGTYRSVPVVGNQMDALDFSPVPPADCLRFRNTDV